MKINVHAGHNFHVPGASGCFSETVEDRKVKNLVISKLRLQGHTVYDCTDEDGTTQSKNLVNIVNHCNMNTVDLDVSIHFNASNGVGHGVEVLIYSNSSSSKAKAQNIVNAIAELGFTNRGVKVRSDLYVLRKTKSPALLIECCFCDSQIDNSIYDAERMATAIVKGITNQVTQSSSTNVVQQPTKDDIELIARQVIAGQWGNGETRKNRLKNAGYDYGEVQAKVNQILNGGTSNQKSIDIIAREVINGKWGNGTDRRTRLSKAGYNYDEVQKRVNQLLK